MFYDYALDNWFRNYFVVIFSTGGEGFYNASSVVVVAVVFQKSTLLSE